MSRQITTKFSTKFKSKILLFLARVRVSKSKLILRPEEIATNFGYKFKTTDVILMCLEILLYKHKAVIKVPEVITQTVNRK